MDLKTTYTTKQTCKMLNLSRCTLFRWEEEGLMSPVPRDWHGWRRYERKHIEDIRKVMEEKQKGLPGVLLPKVLVADDDQRILDVVAETVRQQEYPVVTASGGEEAIRKYWEERPALIFLDVKMPEVNGIEVLRQIRQKDKKVTVVMMTGYPEIESAVNALKERASDYLVKPFDIQQVVEIIRKTLGKGRKTEGERENL